MKCSTNTVLYILQLLQVPSEHHVTSILITLFYLGSVGGLKGLWHGVYYLPPSIVKAKNNWMYTSNPHICLHGVGRDNSNVLTLPLHCMCQSYLDNLYLHPIYLIDT